MSTSEDSELARAAQEGDEEAFSELVARYLPGVYAFCARYLANTEEAEDATQETFLKAWRSLRRFDTRKSLRPWLLAIAKNAATDLMRKRRSVPFSVLDRDDDTAFADTLEDPEPLPEELLARASASEEVERALGELVARDRLILSLRYEKH